MSLIRYQGFDPMRDMEEMLSQLPVNSLAVQRGFVPSLNMYESDGALVVETALPGMKPSDVEVTVEKGVLTISGESKKVHEVDEKNYYRKEIRSGSFFRQVPLPVSVNEDAVSAEFDEGILKVTCPKIEAPKAKKVSVKIVKNDKK
jgi:HSP20 family protein